MIEVEVTGAGIDAIDVGKNEVRVTTVGWETADGGPPLDRRVDRMLVGVVERLSVPEAAVSIERTDDHEWTMFDDQDGSTDLTGPYVLKIELPVVVFVAAEAPSRLAQSSADGTITVDFVRPTRVTIGFRSRIRHPRETVTVPRTLAGAWEAVRWLATGIATDTPDKSFPAKRTHPPAIEFGDRTEVPPSVRRATTADVTLVVPESLAALLVTAPLAYYLQADVRMVSGSKACIEASTLDAPLQLGGNAPLEQDVAALLQRVFFLDCLARNAGPYGVDLREFDLLAALGLDAETLYAQSTAERLASYLRADYSAVADRLPDWHLSVVLEPALRSVRALPYLLDRLSLVQLPDPRSIDRSTLVAESVDRSFASGSRVWSEAPSYDLVRNRTRLGDLQGWLAAGTPADAFRATVSAFEHRLRYYERGPGPRRVVVVINDPAMLDERDAVERIYRSRSEELTIDVTVVETLTRAQLAELLCSPVDFLHFIGHCDASGLRCQDGSLSTATIERTDVQTFFINACGSFDQGLELVRRGSVAGAVTLANVLNPEASRVGMTFARLVMHGYSISRALALASRQSLTNKFYAVVGDGAHRLAQGEDTFPAELTAHRVSPTAVELRFEFPQLNTPGGLAKPRLPPSADFVLRGCPTSVRLDQAAFVDFLASVDAPVVYENAFYWSTDLAVRLRSTSPSALSA